MQGSTVQLPPLLQLHLDGGTATILRLQSSAHFILGILWVPSLLLPEISPHFPGRDFRGRSLPPSFDSGSGSLANDFVKTTEHVHG